mmetsp:Transcript_40379/g.65062  ORF Transcript_40379/g.65062 Transcript_40379/m.65062 type:complete len:506 (-) Transcript_40379:1047-2564(-)
MEEFTTSKFESVVQHEEWLNRSINEVNFWVGLLPSVSLRAFVGVLMWVLRTRSADSQVDEHEILTLRGLVTNLSPLAAEDWNKAQYLRGKLSRALFTIPLVFWKGSLVNRMLQVLGERIEHLRTSAESLMNESSQNPHFEPLMYLANLAGEPSIYASKPLADFPKWFELPNGLTSPRVNLSLCTLGGFTYAIVGGSTNLPSCNMKLVEPKSVFGSVETPQETYNQFRSDVCSVQIDDGLICVIGGCVDEREGQIVSDVALYNASDEIWTRLPSLPEARAACAAGWLCRIPGKEYVLVVAGGGNNTSPALRDVVGLVATFCPSGTNGYLWGERWIELPPLKARRCAPAYCVLRSTTLCVLGGYCDNDNGTMEVHDSVESISVASYMGNEMQGILDYEWQIRRQHLSTPRYAFGAIETTSRSGEPAVLVIGGRNHEGYDIETIQLVLVTSDKYSTNEVEEVNLYRSLHTPRSSFGIALIYSPRRMVVVAGGISGDVELSSIEASYLE